jgi:transcriptional regulator with XRE-family HTH domain
MTLSGRHAAADFGQNLRRLIAQAGLTLDQVAERTELNLRTIKAVLNGRKRPHARTLHKLAAGLGVAMDEFFQDPSLLIHRRFDRETNPLVAEVVHEHRELFREWTEADFDELYSRFGHGGALAQQGVLDAAATMSRRRQAQRKLALLMETHHADLIAGLLDVFYERALARG